MFNDTTYLSFNYYDELHDGDVKLGIRVLQFDEDYWPNLGEFSEELSYPYKTM